MKNTDLKSHPIFKKLDSLNLNPDEYIIMGSGIMYALGIRPIEEINDIDILVSDSGWKKVKEFGEIIHNHQNNTNVIPFLEGKLCIYDEWDPREYTFESVYKDVHFIKKYPFQSLESLLELKAKRNKEKDKRHIGLILNYLEKDNIGPEGV